MTIEESSVFDLLLFVTAATALSCRGASHETPDEPVQVLVERGGAADTGASAAAAEAAENGRVEHEKERAAYLALAPAVPAGPAGSSGVPYWRSCPPHYGVAEADAGVFYCGKICAYGAAPLGKSRGGVPSFCDGDDVADASASCCGRHRCDRNSIKQSPLPGDGPMPSVCSPDEKKAGKVAP